MRKAKMVLMIVSTSGVSSCVPWRAWMLIIGGIRLESSVDQHRGSLFPCLAWVIIITYCNHHVSCNMT